MSQTISKHIAEGFGRGELYAALAYDESDVFGGMKIKALNLNSTTGTVVNSNGIYETLTINGVVSNSVSGIRCLVTTDSTARTPTNLFGGNFAVRLKNIGDRVTGVLAGLQVGVDMGLSTEDQVWAYGINIDFTEISTRATAPKAFICFQDYDYAGTYHCPILFNIGGGGSRCSTGTSGDLEYNDTLHILVNTTNMYIPLSTVEGSYTTAYPIATTSTITSTCVNNGLVVTASTLNAATGRIAKFVGSVAAVNYSDGYGAVEVELTMTGTQVGHVAAASSWINLITGTTAGGGAIITPHNDGIYEEVAVVLTAGTSIVFGARMQLVLGEAPTGCFVSAWDINANQVITALIQCNNTANIGLVSGTTGAATGSIPFVCNEGGTGIKYIRVYDTVA